ncbi:uncharacterized protein [Branchiostoma lanceolatum]
MARLIQYDNHPIRVLQYLDQQRRAGTSACDATVKMEGRHFPAHKIVLCASSGYFETLFKAQTGETREVELSGPTTKGFSAMLEMMYTSQLQISTANVMEVQVAASYLHVMDVVADCTRFLTTSLAAGHRMTDSTTRRVLHYPSRPAELLQHMDSLRRERPSSCDITIQVRNLAFPAHKAILLASSGYLRTVLSGKQNMNEIELQGLKKEGLSAILDMMYTSQLRLSAQNVIDVQIAASYLHMMDVVADCTQFLTECIMSGFMANTRLTVTDRDCQHDVAKPNSETVFAASLYPSSMAEKSENHINNPDNSPSGREHLQAPSPVLAHQREHLQAPSPVLAHQREHLQAPSPVLAHQREHLQAPSPVLAHQREHLQAPSPVLAHQSHSHSDGDVVVKRESEDLDDVRTSEGIGQHQNSLYFEDVCMEGREQSQTSQMSNVYGNNYHQQGQRIQELQTNMSLTNTGGPGLSGVGQQECDIMHYSREQMLVKKGTNNVARNWFRRVVRETVNKYEMTGLRSAHIDDAMAEVFRRCPSLKPDDVWDVRRQFRNFISNKSGHLSRKERGYLVPSKRVGGQRRSQEGTDTPLSPASTCSTSSVHIQSGGEDSVEPHEHEAWEFSDA